MDIFGLTSIDACLSAWGLNVAQSIIEFFFSRTNLGVLVFAIGFLSSIWQSVKEGSFKHFAVFIFICISGFLLIIVPSRQEPHIKSVMEVYGTSSFTSKTLKDSQTTMHTMPLFLSYFGQMADAMSIGIVSIIDNAFTNDFRFLSNPLGVQGLSLQVNQLVNVPIADVKLRKDLDDFMYAYYLPSLNMYIDANPNGQVSNLRALWPGDTNIVHYYSEQGQLKWQEIQNSLMRLINAPQEPWGRIKRLLQQFNVASNDIDNQILASIIRGQLHVNQGHPYWFWVGAIHHFFPFVYGWANFCLYVSFPILMLAMIIFCRFIVFLRYLEIFIWIKSWILTTAIAHYVSMIAFRIQVQNLTEVHGIWEYPYFSVVAVILLCLMPVLTFIVIHKSFQIINNRY